MTLINDLQTAPVSVPLPPQRGRGGRGYVAAGAQGLCVSADWRRGRRRRIAVRSMAGPGLVAGDVVVDALPYFDQGYEAPGVREAVSAGRGRRRARPGRRSGLTTRVR